MFVLLDRIEDKAFCSYSIKELSKIINKHPNTLRTWVKQPNNDRYRVYKTDILKSNQGGKRQ